MEKKGLSEKTSNGILIVITGDGKGKTTAALGMAVRNLGWGRKVSIIQYAKGSWETGELRFMRKSGVEITPVWESSRWIEDVPEDDRRALTEKAMVLTRERLNDDSIDLLILDEINIMMRYNMITSDQILPLLRNRPSNMTVILTGRNALPDIIDAADLVSDIYDIKHQSRNGIHAQKGIEF